jgi:hypothetical protein
MSAILKHTKSESFWDNYINKLNSSVHNALNSGIPELAASILRNPSQNTHFWGFDSIAKAPIGEIEPHERVLRMQNKQAPLDSMLAVWIYDGLLSLADAVGARRVTYPETSRKHKISYGDVDEILDAIEDSIGSLVLFLNPYAGEVGLASKRGIISFRAVQSLYQAWRIRQLMDGIQNPRILEIGAGLGRTAGFAWQLGLRDYSIIDIPLTNAAQGYFLGRTLGESNIRLFGEPSRGGVQIIPASELRSIDGNFDLVVNVDSLTEMDSNAATEYFEFAKRSAPLLLSINHELNPITVKSLYEGDPNIKAMRYPYWIRRGYVEEILKFS